MQAITSSRHDSDTKQIEKDIADANERINSQRRLLLKFLRCRQFKEAARIYDLLETQKDALDALRARRQSTQRSTVSW
jgi:hypothetical protein